MNNADSFVHVARTSVSEQNCIAGMFRNYLSELGVPPEYPYLDLYWSESGRFPYLLCIADEVIGFALVRTEAQAFQMAEFYIVPAWRRRAIGRAAAAALFMAHPGRWEVSSFPGNAAAEAFWASVVASYGKCIEENAGVRHFDADGSLTTPSTPKIE